MSSTFKRLVGIIGILVLAAIIYSSPQSNAQTTVVSTHCPPGTQLKGWAWSTNIGWISFNSENSGGEGGPHCVSINNNVVSGWAWSSNIGWIKFGGLSGYPTVSGAATGQDSQISGGQLVGWARACAGTASGDCSSMTARTDGWDGWLELSGSTHPLTYSGTNFAGYAWGSNVIGWTDFSGVSTGGGTVGTPAPSCQMTYDLSSSGVYEVNWVSANANSCEATTGNFTAGTFSGSYSPVYPAANASTRYAMKCTPKYSGNTDTTCFVDIDRTGGVGCSPNCPPIISPPTPFTPPDIQMWINKLNNAESQNKKLATLTIKLGQPAKISWENTKSASFDHCLAYVDDLIIAGFSTTPAPQNSPFQIPQNMLTIGQHQYTMKCMPVVSESNPNPVYIPGRTSANTTSLNISVTDPSIEEI